MPDISSNPTWLARLIPVATLFAEGKLALALRNVLESLTLAQHLRDRLSYHGMYQILEYDSTLEVQDVNGEEATITPRKVIRFLQDNVVAIHDHAWGDGELFAEYTCQPGIPVDFVDFYEDRSTVNAWVNAWVNACSVCCSLPRKSPLVIPPALHRPPQRGFMSAEKGP